jgi:predicted nucleic acid-binding protein
MAVFADTSFYAAIVSRRDEWHARAKAIAAQIREPIVTTEFILIETANFCSTTPRRSVFVRLVDHLRRSTNVEIIPASSRHFERGLELFSARDDKTWSLTDCISIVVMQERRIQSALTADRHFEQAGLSILLK